MQETSETAETRLRAVDLSPAVGWATTLFLGLVTVAVGVIVLSWPDETLTVLSVLFGIQLLLFGLFRFISAFAEDSLAPGLVGFVGLVGMVAGVVVLRHPFDTVAVLATVLGVVWIVTGAIDVMSGITDKSLTDRELVALAGIVSIGVGVVVVAWPSPTITAIAWVAGLYLIVHGLALSAMAFMLRSAAS